MIKFLNMYNFKLRFIKSLLQVRKRYNRYLFIASFISVVFLFLKLIRIDILFNFDSNIVFGSLFGFFWMVSSIFIILFLPSYPIFFTFYKKIKFNALEKISLTIVMNLSFYMIIGYFGNGVGYALNMHFFFSVLLCSYFGLLIIGYVIKKKFKTVKNLTSPSEKTVSLDSYEDFQVLRYIKNKIS